ncbi:MAG TPA: hypothetical protein VH120_08205 [Gemmataceae bacterium]|nr:hypothetical protein [Gemmataceae bacterium]
MIGRSRREFLADVGRGAIAAGIGAGLAGDLGLAPARADGPDRLTFGPLEPLVGLMHDTPPDKLQPILVNKLRDGVELRELVAAAALANARTFGGEDYTGFHTLMALAPAFHMAGEMPADKRALPVLKVIYRNANRIQERGVNAGEVLHAVNPVPLPEGQSRGELLREAVRKQDMTGAESMFATMAGGPAAEAFAALLVAVEDALDVHRIVLPWRAWCLLDIVGPENAHTLLRQSVRYCVKEESPRVVDRYAPVRALLPQVMDKFHLTSGPKGTRAVDDAWVDGMSDTIFRSKPEHSAEAVAGALADGVDPAAVGEAISLAANQLVLRDSGRLPGQTAPNKPVGSVHGDSIGVHACDSANAWRQMARVGGPRHAAACLVLGAYQVAWDRVERGGNFLEWKPRPWAEHKAAVESNDPARLMQNAEDAIRSNDQARACAVVAKLGEVNHSPRAVFDLLLRYAVSEEGALHAEKYYRTVSEEFTAIRPSFRWRQLVALARVTASECGTPAAGQADARRLLGV